MLHEIVVFPHSVDSQQSHHPDSADAKEVCRRDVVDVLQEEETQIVELELCCKGSTIMRKRVILRKGRRLAKALVSR